MVALTQSANSLVVFVNCALYYNSVTGALVSLGRPHAGTYADRYRGYEFWYGRRSLRGG